MIIENKKEDDLTLLCGIIRILRDDSEVFDVYLNNKMVCRTTKIKEAKAILRRVIERTDR